MKITLNAMVTPETIDGFLDRQKQKAEKIESFCKKNKIDELHYRDSELEFEYSRKGGAKNGKD